EGGVGCASGFVGAIIDLLGPQCIPTFCDNATSFPACGGTCPAGLTCTPLRSYGDAEYCICADGGIGCDSACGGFVCAGGEVCSVDTQGQCGCTPRPST